MQNKSLKNIVIPVAAAAVALSVVGGAISAFAAEPSVANTAQPAASEVVTVDVLDEENSLGTLSLPEEYSIQYQVKSNRLFGDSYTLGMTKITAGIYVYDGESDEQYLFKKMSNGKYLFCKYSRILGKYYATALTPKVCGLINSGLMNLDMVTIDSVFVSVYTSAIELLFAPYLPFIDYMQLQGQETVNGVQCYKYTVTIYDDYRPQELAFWVNPENGLCMKSTSSNKILGSSYDVSEATCTLFQTQNLTLPEYDLSSAGIANIG